MAIDDHLLQVEMGKTFGFTDMRSKNIYDQKKADIQARNQNKDENSIFEEVSPTNKTKCVF